MQHDAYGTHNCVLNCLIKPGCVWTVLFKAALEVMELDNASLWWAGKEIVRGKKLCDFVGKNEKTKIVCKLQKVSDGQFFSVECTTLCSQLLLL